MTQHSDNVEIKTLVDIPVVSNRWVGHYQDTGKSLGKLYKLAGRFATGAPINLYHDSEYKVIDADIESCVPVKQEIASDPSGECCYKVLPGGLFYTLVHEGPYETLGVSYNKLIEKIESDGKRGVSPSREIYHKGPGMLLKGNPNKYRTEIQIPVE